jgi:hypothetical protein
MSTLTWSTLSTPVTGDKTQRRSCRWAEVPARSLNLSGLYRKAQGSAHACNRHRLILWLPRQLGARATQDARRVQVESSD